MMLQQYLLLSHTYVSLEALVQKFFIACLKEAQNTLAMESTRLHLLNPSFFHIKFSRLYQFLLDQSKKVRYLLVILINESVKL